MIQQKGEVIEGQDTKFEGQPEVIKDQLSTDQAFSIFQSNRTEQKNRVSLRKDNSKDPIKDTSWMFES